MGVFCEIDAFPLGVFSVRNSNLRNLKGNGNAPMRAQKKKCPNLDLLFGNFLILQIYKQIKEILL